MMIGNATSHALSEIASRQADLRGAYTPGATASHTDVATADTPQLTIDPLTVAVPSDAYLVGRDERGRPMYTRDGVLHVADNTLVDRFNQPVLGFVPAHSTLAPLRIDPVDAALGRTAGLHINADGTVSYPRVAIDPRSGTRTSEEVVVGRVALARFSAATKLQPIDQTRMTAPPGVQPHLGNPGDGNFGALRPHLQSSSGIDINLGIEKLSEAYLAFDALRAAHAAQGKVEKTAMDLVK